MITSMTAYARKEQRQSWGTLTCELRSVNQRFLDLNFRLPEILKEQEFKLREAIRKRLTRGKIDCTMRFVKEDTVDSRIVLNHDLIAGLQQAARDLSAPELSESALGPMDILHWPGVVQQPELDGEAVGQAVQQLFSEVIDDFLQMRGREGSEIKQLLLTKLASVKEIVKHVRGLLPQIIQANKARLIQRLEEISQDIDQNRLEQELVYLAQKADVEEELDRLASHVDEVERVLNQGGACGRRLDFLMQELNREANTLSSKSIAAGSSLQAVELKVLIEQMREQIQNIE